MHIAAAAHLWVKGEVSADKRCACPQELHEDHKVRTLSHVAMTNQVVRFQSMNAKKSI